MDKNEIARHANELDALSHEEDGVEYWLLLIDESLRISLWLVSLSCRKDCPA